MIRDINWASIRETFNDNEPFRHVVIDNFFIPEVAEKLSEEFPDPNATQMHVYKNPIENKLTLNNWNLFPTCTYRAFSMFGRENFIENMKMISREYQLSFDYGLNGGGWHMHGNGGNLNVHLDYNVHPKLGDQRFINIIVYLTKDWKQEWGGGLELWSGSKNEPFCKEKTIDNEFNRAIIFDTTQNSWHGLPDSIKCPEGVYRKSIAAYFVRPSPNKTEQRGKALFVPRSDQKDNEEVLNIIRKRSDANTSAEVYQKMSDSK